MKIEKIYIENLGSWALSQKVDFTCEPLSAGRVFAVTGVRGVGKHTLLDALCLALYNRAPRFEKSGEMSAAAPRSGSDEPEMPSLAGLLRHGAREGGCGVVFSTCDGERYEARWRIKVKGGVGEEPERSLRQLAPRKETVEHAEMQARIELATGLSYEDFVRSVILPQRDMANFLKAAPIDKPVLLEKLTGTEVYRQISQKIYDHAAQATLKLKNLESLAEGLLHDRLEPAVLAEAEEQKALLETQIQTLKKNLDDLRRQQQWFVDLDRAAGLLRTREAEFAEATKACTAVRNDELRLNRYDSLLEFQPLFREIVMRRDDLLRIRTEESLNKALVEEALGSEQEARRNFEAAAEQAAQAENQLAAERKNLDRGYILTGQIGELSQQLQKLDSQVRTGRIHLQEREEDLRTKTQELEALTAQIEKLHEQQQSLSMYRLIFEKFELINDKLTQLRSEALRNEESHKSLAALSQRLTELQNSTQKVKKEQQDQQAAVNSLKSELFIHRQTNGNRDAVSLQKRAADISGRMAGLKRAALLWQHISQGYNNISEKGAALRRAEMEIERLKTAVNRKEIEQKAAHETFVGIQTAYDLSRAENILRLRKQLKEGNACPVCGATHHPYYTETERASGELQANLQKNFLLAKENREQLQEQLADLNQQLAACKARKEAETKALLEVEQRQQADVEEWQNYAFLDPSFKDCSAAVNRPARTTMLELLKDNALRDYQTAEKELETFNFHQAHINSLNEKIEALESTLADKHAYLDKVETDMQVIKAKTGELERVMYSSERSVQTLYSDLDNLLSISGWFIQWKKNPETFRKQLSERFQTWNTLSTNLESAKRNEVLLRETIKAAEANLRQAKSALLEAQNSQDATLSALEAHKAEIQRLFGENQPREVAQSYELRLRNAQVAEKQALKLHEEAATRLQNLLGIADELAKARQAIQQIEQKCTQQLDLRILRFNGSHSPVQFKELESLFADPCDWKALRQNVEELAKQRMLAEHRLEEARSALLACKADPQRPEGESDTKRKEVAKEITGKALDLEESERKLTEVEARLLSHKNCEHRARELSLQIQTAAADQREWADLNDRLGSRDGSKFRHVAQHQAFRALVEQANLYLQRIFPKFELQILPRTLSLEVVNHDMLNDPMPVEALSQGESFVVSLALSLGLASLSARGLPLGSLFVEESFESQDYESFEAVLTALANFNSLEGLTLGIVSSSEQIETRIFPQIRLTKRPDGQASKVEIL